jgi:hypothetical protein
MKDIKELIYAAVEENALKFQELVNNQLQVRAYDAIEALRPEIGASMFGEAKKMEDDEDEEDMEDEDEMDDKKKSMKEALHPNQQKIDVVDDEKIDAKDFAKLRQMKKMKEEVEQIDEAVFDSKDAAQSVANKLKTKHDDGNYHVKADNGKHRVVHAYYPNSKVKKQIANLDEEVGPSTSRYHVLVHKSSSTNIEKAHHAASGAGNKNFRPGTGLARMDKPGGSHDPTGGDYHVIHAPDHATHENLRKNLSDYGARATIVDTHTGKREDVHEEVEQVNERSREDLISQIKVLKKPAIKHGFDWPSNDSTDKTSTKDLKSFHKSARSVIKQGLKAKAKAKADVQEVAMPKNAADWQAMINHQIQIAGHPVATDAQFRATHGKDMSKIASLEPGEDMLQYATAQGGTVKK